MLSIAGTRGVKHSINGTPSLSTGRISLEGEKEAHLGGTQDMRDKKRNTGGARQGLSVRNGGEVKERGLGGQGSGIW